jgi:hypothetical protein
MNSSQPPQSPPTTAPPESFFSSNLSYEKLKQWSLLTRIYLGVNIMYLVFLLLVQGNEWQSPAIILKGVDAIALLLWSYVLMSFRRLLWFRFHITSVSIFINALIVVGFFWWAIEGLGIIPKDYQGAVLGLVLIIQGVAGMLLAKALLASDMHTVRLKRFALVLFAASVCYASLVMAFIGVALSLTAYWHLSCVFDESAKEQQAKSS